VQQIGAQFSLLCAGLKIRVITAYGGTSDRPQSTALSEGVEVVCGAPGRVFDLMSQGYLQYAHLSYCILDEADRMFDMGFIDDIKNILNRMPSRRQTLMFSATLPPAIKKLAADYLFYPREVRIGPVAPPSELKHEMLAADAEQKYGELSKLLDDVHESVLVFCGTRKRAGEVAVRLGRDGERTAALHADRTQAERDRALAAFKERRIRVLVATDVASRGLDIDDVDLVVNYDVPRDPEDYVHRVGRTARAKKTGLALTFVAPEDMKYVKRIEQFIGQRVDWRGELAQDSGRGGRASTREAETSVDQGGARGEPQKRSGRDSGKSAARGKRGGSGRGKSRGQGGVRPSGSGGSSRGKGRGRGGSKEHRGDHSGDSSYVD